ncbi:MAG: RsmE family RNA methyltransferase [Planctomycetota bacterium]
MAKLRRFTVGSLEGLEAGAVVTLPADEQRHVHVLRLKTGVEIEVLDAAGRSGRAVIEEDSAAGVSVRLLSVEVARANGTRVKVILGVAWPKGKRAAVMVEKCAELGVSELVPIQFVRSVVSKDEESEGVVRLRRIAAEASKQSHRDDVMSVGAEMTLREFLTRFETGGTTLLLDPYVEAHLVTEVAKLAGGIERLMLLIGPEGGMTEAEITLAEELGARKVRLAANVLRIETAAMAAAAICQGVLESCKKPLEIDVP